MLTETTVRVIADSLIANDKQIIKGNLLQTIYKRL